MANQICARHSPYILILMALIHFAVLVLGESIPTQNMSRKERNILRNEARNMFYHAYKSYMDNAYPADELMPLSCKGRYRGVTPSRGDMDDILGNPLPDMDLVLGQLLRERFVLFPTNLRVVDFSHLTTFILTAGIF